MTTNQRQAFIEINLSFRDGVRSHKVDETLFAEDDGWSDVLLQNGGKAEVKHVHTSSSSSQVSEWWKALNDIDPITLEPLSQLTREPFKLESDFRTTSQKSSSVPTTKTTGKTFYFDGEALAEFLTTTANFINPINRQALSKGDCERLDLYLQRHQLREYEVCRLFTLNRKLANQRRRQTRQQVQTQRQETLLLFNLFNNASEANTLTNTQQRPTHQQQQQQQRRRRRPPSTTDSRSGTHWPSLPGFAPAADAEPSVSLSNKTMINSDQQYNYEKWKKGASTGLRIIDDDEWVSASVKREVPRGASPIKWPLEKTTKSSATAQIEKESPKCDDEKDPWSWRTKSKNKQNDKIVKKYRPRLKLLPRTVPLENHHHRANISQSAKDDTSSTVNETNRRISIFGDAKPRNINSTSNRNHISKELSLGTSSCECVIAGYPIAMIVYASQGRRQWVSTVEKTHFRSLVNTDTRNLNECIWKPPASTSQSNLHFLKCLAYHWGLAVRSESQHAVCENNSRPSYHFSKNAYSAEPALLLSDVLLSPNMKIFSQSLKKGSLTGANIQSTADRFASQLDSNSGKTQLCNDTDCQFTDETFWTIDDEVEEDEETSRKNLESPTTNLTENNKLLVADMQATILLSCISTPAASRGSFISDDTIHHSISASLPKYRGVQPVAQIEWVSDDAVVLHCTTSKHARALCASLRSLPHSTGTVKRSILGAGIRCLVQWCSATTQDLRRQKLALDYCKHGGTPQGMQSHEQQKAEKNRRREERNALAVRNKAVKQAHDKMRHQTKWEALAISSDDEAEVTAEDGKDVVGQYHGQESLVPVEANRANSDIPVLTQKDNAAFQTILGMGFGHISQEKFSRLMKDFGQDLNRVIEQILLQ